MKFHFSSIVTAYAVLHLILYLHMLAQGIIDIILAIKKTLAEEFIN